MLTLEAALAALVAEEDFATNAGQSSDYSRPGIRASFALRRVDLEIRFRQMIALERIAETLPGLLPRQDDLDPKAPAPAGESPKS